MKSQCKISPQAVGMPTENRRYGLGYFCDHLVMGFDPRSSQYVGGISKNVVGDGKKPPLVAKFL